MTRYRCYIGTFTQAGKEVVPGKEGIFWYQFDADCGELTFEGNFDAGPNPAFLTLSPDGRFLYTVNEVHEYQGKPGGAISAFRVDPASGQLTYLNSQPTIGESPCYISLDRTARFVLVSNYAGGSILSYPRLADGNLDPAISFIQHEGHGPNPERQEKAHAHSIRMEPGNRLAVAADLGLDKLKLYRLDNLGRLLPASPTEIAVHPGAGPRHLDFHPSGRWMAVLNELDSTVDLFETDFSSGVYRHLQTASSLQDDYAGEKWAADIHFHPNGKFLFASNRAHDSLAYFTIDAEHGRISLLGTVPSGGKTPRNFALDPSGNWILSANQDSHNLVVFRLDRDSGKLQPTGVDVKVHKPVCVQFAP